MYHYGGEAYVRCVGAKFTLVVWLYDGMENWKWASWEVSGR